ncbi:MAG TPA: hypothetical protein VLB44_13955, partial [Kofleriaceae bacterium]|nr:hypothetical protein [Kofleriaceae bacterium]
MRAAAATCLLLLGACDQLFNLDHLNYKPDEPLPDAEIPVLIDAPTACNGMFVGQSGAAGTGLLRVCVPPTATPTLALSGPIDTNNDCDLVIGIDAFVEVCVKWAQSIAVS